MVFLCIVLFGYPALISVPFAYGISDLIEGVPPDLLLAWLPGYFIDPTCFWGYGAGAASRSRAASAAAVAAPAAVSASAAAPAPAAVNPSILSWQRFLSWLKIWSWKS